MIALPNIRADYYGCAVLLAASYFQPIKAKNEYLKISVSGKHTQMFKKKIVIVILVITKNEFLILLNSASQHFTRLSYV